MCFLAAPNQVQIMIRCPGTGCGDEYRDVRGPIETKPSRGMEALEEAGVDVGVARAIVTITPQEFRRLPRVWVGGIKS